MSASPQRVHHGLPRMEVHRETSEECTARIPHRLYPSTAQRACATSASPEESITDRPVPRHVEMRYRSGLLAFFDAFSRATRTEHVVQGAPSGPPRSGAR